MLLNRSVRRITTAANLREFKKHENLLKSLDLSLQNSGVYNGTWVTTKNQVWSVNPSTNLPIASVGVGGKSSIY